MIIFLKNFYRIRIALLLYISSIAAVLIFFFNPLRFRRDCKGRNFILNLKFYLKFFLFCFQLISQFKPSLTLYFIVPKNRCSLAEWCKDRQHNLLLPSFLESYFWIITYLVGIAGDKNHAITFCYRMISIIEAWAGLIPTFVLC